MASPIPSSPPPPIGSTVAVPGSMHGTVKFVGPVVGKRGIFAGVQLAPEFAARGKNSGDVDGKQYFRTTVPGSGIFLPVEKAVKMDAPAFTATTNNTAAAGKSHTNMGAPATPKMTNALNTFNQGGRTPSAAAATTALGALPKPNFSQSVGPMNMRPASPSGKSGIKRESLPRPASPLRKPITNANTTTPAATVGKLSTPKTRPSIGLAKSTIGTGPNGARYGGAASPAGRMAPGATGGNKFSQSLRQTVVTPSRGNKPLTPLGPEASFDEEPAEDGGGDSGTATPTPAALAVQNSTTDPAASEKYEAEIRRLKDSLEERDRQMRDQTSTLSEMEKSLSELQRLLPTEVEISEQRGSLEDVQRAGDEDLPTDVQNLRQALREKNEKIKALTAEFDANRADFRSTIDTLEMASSETERVYEKRVDELLEEVRNLQDRSEDVEGVARQFRQLEELVQELEEGLEDARRGESEARAENEFLRGEVERLRSEIKRIKEVETGRKEAERKLSGEDEDGESELETVKRQLEQKDDEVRGLKAIITEMNRKSAGDLKSPPLANGNINRNVNEDTYDHRVSRELELQIRDLKALLSQKADREEELENEVSRLRSSSYSQFPAPPNRNSAETIKHRSTGTNGSRRLSDRTVVPSSAGTGSGGSQTWHDASSTPSSPVKALHSRGHSRTNTQTKILAAVAEGEDGTEHETRTEREGEDGDTAQSQSGRTDVSSMALWCEICEEGGHDILTCRNMFGSGAGKKPLGASPGSERKKSSESQRSGRDAVREGLSRTFGGRTSQDQDRPAPLRPGGWRNNNNNTTNTITATTTSTPAINNGNEDPSTPRPSVSIQQPPLAPPPSTLPPPPAAPAPAPENLNQAGMVAGKSTGTIDPDKWCALCERDGHESVDCPFEDAF